MSFGYGFGDLVTLGRLAWSIYKSCKEAPGSFKDISDEVLSLHAVLKEMEESLSGHEPSPQRQESLQTIVQGCKGILDDLQALITKYESFGTMSKRTWDRLKWGTNDITELRSRLISNTVLLAAFMSTSQVTVERKLDNLVQDFRAGRHEESVMTTITVESLALDEQEAWRAIRKELGDIGISVAAFDANKAFIMNWFQKALETGMLEEEIADSSSELELPRSTTREYFETSENLEGQKNAEQSSPQQSSSNQRANPISGANFKNQELQTDAKRISKKNFPVKQNKSPATKLKKSTGWRASVLLAVFRSLQTRKAERRFLDACSIDDYVAAERELGRGVDVDTPFEPDDNSTILHTAIKSNNYQMTKWLLDNGANVERAHTKTGLKPLMCCCSQGNLELVKLLLEHGARVNVFTFSGRTSALSEAAKKGYTGIVRYLLEHGADLNMEAGVKPKSTALFLAISSGHDETAFLLVGTTTATTRKNFKGQTALHLTVLWKCTQTLKALLNKGPDLEAKDDKGYTALEYAFKAYNSNAAKLLLEKGANYQFLFGPPGRVYYVKGLKACFDAAFMATLGLMVLKMTDRDRRYKRGERSSD